MSNWEVFVTEESYDFNGESQRKHQWSGMGFWGFGLRRTLRHKFLKTLQSARHFPHQTMKSDFSVYLWIIFWARVHSSLGTFFSFQRSGNSRILEIPFCLRGTSCKFPLLSIFFPIFQHLLFTTFKILSGMRDNRWKKRNSHVLPSCEIFLIS